MTAPVLAFRRWGGGPPVVLLYGLGASARYRDRLAAIRRPQAVADALQQLVGQRGPRS